MNRDDLTRRILAGVEPRAEFYYRLAVRLFDFLSDPQLLAVALEVEGRDEARGAPLEKGSY